jgi:NACHT domain
MEGTRQSILDQVMAWVTTSQEGNDASRRNTYWLYGPPGIGKTSLAHSICTKLHNREQLAGMFFCRRDDPNLSEPRNILPTLINKLAGTLPPFRTIVAKRLRNNPNLTPGSMKGTLLLDFICSLPRYLKRTLVFVIDALDECGDIQERLDILRALNDVAAHARWLKIIITSRPEVDIQRFLDTPTLSSSHLRYDLATDQEAGADLRTFAQSQFNLVASRWHLSTPWPEESLFERSIARADGLFIFIKTIVLALEHCKDDPTEFLKATLQDSAGTGLTSLNGLYSSILKAQIRHNKDKFQQVIGVLLTTAPHRPLCKETIAELAGVRPNLVKKWVNDLSPLLYKDKGANQEIRVRHVSIYDFFLSTTCHHNYRVNLHDVNTQLGIACLETLVEQLRFNICDLDDSRLPNAAVKDLPSRIKKHISDALQYSSLYWSNHLCFTPDGGDQRVLGWLKKFFEGLHPVFWIEVLSIMEMVAVGAPSLRRVISWVKVSTPPACC